MDIDVLVMDVDNMEVEKGKMGVDVSDIWYECWCCGCGCNVDYIDVDGMDADAKMVKDVGVMNEWMLWI